jgi:VIT1/CCC1 family predicted Fe2+/Mn2+ transporter
MALSRRQAS